MAFHATVMYFWSKLHQQERLLVLQMSRQENGILNL